jgi:hypothetical protein
MLEELIAWSYQIPALAWLRNARYGMPIAQSFHILGFTVLLGSCVAWNLSLIRLGFRLTPLKVLARDLWPWANAGLALVILSGVMVFVVDPARYLASSTFLFKMALLAAAIAFQYTIFKRTVLDSESDRLTVNRRWTVALGSLLLWFGVGWAGRFIAFL